MHSAPSSLYIHIPFCRSKCSYCDFFSVPQAGALPDSYISALCSNIVFRCRQFSVTKLDTVYIGGGTPSLLSPEQLNRILGAVRSAAPLSSDAEITMEANPADITQEMLASLEEAGVNRLAAGIQSVDHDVLAALGRRSDAARVEQTLRILETEWLSDAGLSSKGEAQGRRRRLSLDLIAGLPGLSDEAFEQGVRRIIETGADHVSLYSLMLEEGTRLERDVSLGKVAYSDEANDRQWIRGRDMLVSAGYIQYEVSNFARPGFESRHNSVYWHMQDYLGTGAGGAGTVGSYRWTEAPDIAAFTAWWNRPDGEPPADVELLEDETREFEFLMMGFRLLEGVSSREYGRRFGKSLAERLGAEPSEKADDALFADWQKRGLARTYSTADGDTRYALTAEGILLLNQFLEALL